jgi:type II secretory pathway pseudopilin PulG
MKTQKQKRRNKSKMNNTLMNVFNNVKKTRGASLAEFAVVAAMMGTMATVALPKFSGVGAGAEKQKTLSNMDLVAQAASNFYNATAIVEKKGRFPGQDKYTKPVGGYGVDGSTLAEIEAAKTQVESDIEAFQTFGSTLGANFKSVFGTEHPDAAILIVNTTSITNDDSGDNGYTDGAYNGELEWMSAFGGEAIASPFQDGHYIYAVVPGYGAEAPTLYVADLVNPAEYNTSLKP